MIAAILYGLTGFVELLLGLRFLFRLLGANPLNGIVNFVYDISTPLVKPFANMFGQSATVTGQGAVVPSVFDWSALIAMVVYGLIGALLIGMFSRR